MKTVRKIITVTQGHIDRGKPCNYGSCPIAHAIDGTAGLKGGVVTGLLATCEDEETEQPLVAKLSPAAKKFVKDFDSGNVVQPSRFVLTFVDLG